MNRKFLNAMTGLLLCSSALFADLSQPWNNPSGGTLPTGCKHLTFYSAANKTTIGYIIYLPPHYDSSSTNAVRYPVVYSLHGMSGNEWGNITLVSTLQSAIDSKAVNPMIMVFVCGRGNTFYADSKDGNVKCETSIIKELIPHVDSLFHTIPDRAHRAVNGVSMGGFGALMLAFKHYEFFGHVGSFIAALVDWDTLSEQQFDQSIPTKIFGSDSNYFNNNYYPFTFVEKNIDTLKAMGMKVRMADGDNDYQMEPLYDYNKAMFSLLKSKGIPVVFDTIKGGGHSIDLSSAHASSMLKFHSDNFTIATSALSPAKRAATKSAGASYCGRIIGAGIFFIPRGWLATSKKVEVYSIAGRLMGYETIEAKTILDGSPLSKRYGKGTFFLKPVGQVPSR